VKGPTTDSDNDSNDEPYMNKAAQTEATFGIRVSLPEGDPFARLLDDDWTKTHWYSNRRERDREMKEMSREHEYSRKGDKPRLIFEAIDNATKS
jgi:hypothetical protein